MHLPGPLAGSRRAFSDYAQGADLRANRRDRGGGHHLGAGAAWRTEKLGLSVLLGARRNVHAVGLDERRVSRRSHRLAELALARGRWKSGASAKPVRPPGRTTADRVASELVTRIRRVTTGANRQCRVGATPARHLWGDR